MMMIWNCSQSFWTVVVVVVISTFSTCVHNSDGFQLGYNSFLRSNSPRANNNVFSVNNYNDALTSTTSTTHLKSVAGGGGDEEEFNPFLQSPHSFPNGIDGSKKKASSNTEESSSSAPTNEADAFDPLRSPHSYSKGIDAEVQKQKNRDDADEEEDWTPMKMKNVKKDFEGASKSDYKTQKSTFTRAWAVSPNSDINGNNASSSNLPPKQQKKDKQQSSPELFDPLLSPHAYPKGTSAGPVKVKDNSNTPPPQIGILLIDHGSRRPSSNEHLEKVAKLYQSSAPSNFIVRAAHMEIAPPSIKDIIGDFWREHKEQRADDENAKTKGKLKKIICHPYFLSPGRHVTEDVPELIQEAVSELNSEDGLEAMNTSDDDEEDSNDKLFYLGEGDDMVQVIMTDPVGSKLDMMVNIIGEMVTESLDEDDIASDESMVKVDDSEPKYMNGFFGEVQRMMDEQL